MFPSYRNQSVGLQSKSTDWFLYDGNIGRKGVNNRVFYMEYYDLHVSRRETLNGSLMFVRVVF